MSISKKTIAAIYNPKIQSREDLIRSFVVRNKLFEKLFKEIQSTTMEFPEQHYLIEGKRGMGKTSLLLRLSYAIEQDPLLNQKIIPIIFNEEEYSVRKMFRFWERIIESLEDQSPLFEGLMKEVKVLSNSVNSDDAYEKELFQLLISALQQKNRKIILFIDNFGDMFQKFNEREAHRLRKILQTACEIRIFAASSVVLEAFYLYKHPFYEFFKIERLEGLSSKETRTLLLKLGELHGLEQVVDIVKNQRGRVEALRRLTGGVIRTIILLFEIFVDDHRGNAFEDLENILDRVTPLYKHRMDDLPAQQQQIVEAIALSWDAVQVKEISEKTRMESKVISAQLSQLVKNEIVKKIRTSTKNHLYQINERFFNIWYLMRHGRHGDRQKVIWLVRFLEEWCDEEELVKRAEQHVKGLEKGQFNQRSAFLLSEALSSTRHLPKETQHELLTSTRDFLNKNGSHYLQKISASDIELQEKSEEALRQKQYTPALNFLLKMKEKNHFQIAQIYQKGLKDFQLAKKHYVTAIQKGSAAAMNNLAILYEYHFKDLKKAKELYQKALDHNNQQASYNLALLYKNSEQDYQKSTAYYQQAIKQGDTDAMFNLANLYNKELKDPDLAIHYYQMASEQGHVRAMSNLAFVYLEIDKDFDTAENYFKQSLENGLLQNEDFLHISQNNPLNFHLLFLLARGAYEFLYENFNTEQAQDLKLQDRLKPFYYSLLSNMSQEHADEFLRMGNELKETVNEINQQVALMRKMYQ